MNPLLNCLLPVFYAVALGMENSASAATVSFHIDGHFSVPGAGHDVTPEGLFSDATWADSPSTGEGDNSGADSGIFSMTDIDGSTVNVSAATTRVGTTTNQTYGFGGATTAIEELYDTYLNFDAPGQGSLEISQINSFATSYSLVVYFIGQGAAYSGIFTINGIDYAVNAAGALPSSLVDATSTGNGNYLLIEGLTADSVTITASNNFIGITGFQLDGVPEPSAALLGGIGTLALLRRRKR